jgi:hypothetical protein
MGKIAAVVQLHLPTRQQVKTWTMQFFVSQITDLYLTAWCEALGISLADVKMATRIETWTFLINTF